MATVPLSGTDIILLSGVPFSNDYKHTRWFDNADAQYTYFQAKHLLTIGEANFQRIDGKHFISVNCPLDNLWGCNYLMFRNGSYGTKWFYAFVTKLQYVQKNTTYVHFEIDVLQTWMFGMSFKPSFVIREHCKLWNTDGSPVINTVDEGLNYGTDYEVKAIENYTPYDPVFFLVIVAKTAMHKLQDGTDYTGKILPTTNGLPQPLTYYVVPFKLDGSSPTISVGFSPLENWTVLSVLQALCYGDKMVGNIVSTYVTEWVPGATYNSSTDNVDFDDAKYEKTYVQAPGETTFDIDLVHAYDMPSYSSLAHTVYADKYSDYDSVTESKLLMYPYTVLTLDDFKGNRINLKNEYINSDEIALHIRGSLGTMNKVSYNVFGYLDQTGVSELENAVINNSPNDLPILSDYLSAYLQGNKNTIENQKNTAIFNGATGAIGAVVGGVASAMTGNVAGAISSGVGVVRGAGSAVLQLQGIQAKIKDIDNMPPTVVKMGGNSQFDFGNGITGIFVIKKQITSEYRKKLADFFKLYGYKVNEVKVPNFHTRQSWNYVQTSACNIVGYFNNEDLEELKQVFDNGITLWHTDDVGNYALANEVI